MAEAITDDKLIEIIVASSELGKEKFEQFPRTDLFIDSKNVMWNRTKLVPITDGRHRILWICDFADSDDVIVYGVPCERPEHYGFVRVAVQRHGIQGQGGKIGVAGSVAMMSLETFTRELGEDMWALWVQTMNRKQAREAVDEMRDCLNEVLEMTKDGIASSPEVIGQVHGLVQGCLDSVDSTGDDEDEDGPEVPAPPQ